MNKSELVAAIAEETNLSKADAGRAVDAMISTITKTLASGDSVTLVGFGTFSVVDRAARTARDPRTGEAINVAASRQPKFKAGAALKSAVNG